VKDFPAGPPCSASGPGRTVKEAVVSGTCGSWAKRLIVVNGQSCGCHAAKDRFDECFLPCGSGAHAVMEVDDAVSESALVQEVKPRVHLIRQRALAAADEDRV
jgi:hypothetical protein